MVGFNDLNRYLLESQEQLDAQAIANPARLQEFQRRIPDDSVERGGRGIGVIEKYNHSIVAALDGSIQNGEGVDEAKLFRRYEVLGEAQADLWETDC